MSIMRDMMESLDKLSVAQIQQGLQQGRYPAYLAIPAIELKTRMQKQFEQQQAMQQQPPQSTIAEQIMQEAQGVDQLPSNLPEEYAGGGIVAFEDGGEVERYQMGGELGMSSLGGYEPPKPRRWNPFTNSYEPLTPEQEAQLAAGEAELKQTYGATPTAPVPSAPMAGRQDMMDANRAMTGARPPAAGPGAGAAPAGIAGLGAAAPYRGPSAMDQTNKMLYGTEAEPGFLARSTARQAALDQRVQDAEGKVTGKAYEGLEKSLQKEEQERGTDKAQAKSMAIFKAGLAMMAGTSPNAFENIGKGAMVGLDDYQKAAKDIKQAEKEHRRMMAQIEQARRAEDAGNRDRAIARLDKATEFEERRDQFVMSALNTAGGKDADRLFETWKLNTEGAIRRDVANIGAGATLGAAALRGKPRESDVTPQLRMQAMKMVDEGKLETDALASLGLRKMPKDEKGMEMFRKKVDELRERELRRIIGVAGGSFGSPAETAAPSGFRYLGQE